jgi:hypothetical protein
MHATVKDELFFENDLATETQHQIIRLVKSGYFAQYQTETPDDMLIKAYRTGWASALHLAATSTEWRTDEGILKLIKG